MEKSPDHDKAQPQQVNTSDGISKEEAVIVAKKYLVEKGYREGYVISKPTVTESSVVEGCWTVSFPTTWRVRMEQGLKWLAVDVDKKTGQIRSAGWGPS